MDIATECDRFSDRWAEPLPAARPASASARSVPGCSRRRYLSAPSRRDRDSRPARRAWRDIGAAARTQSWLWPGNRARRHRHGCRSGAGIEPLQLLPVELVGDIVAGRMPSRCRRSSRAGFGCMPRMFMAGRGMRRFRPGLPRRPGSAPAPGPVRQSREPQQWQRCSRNASCDCSPRPFRWTARPEGRTRQAAVQAWNNAAALSFPERHIVPAVIRPAGDLDWR